MNRLRKFLALPASERLLALEAALELAVASVLLAVLPFHRIARRLGPLGDDIDSTTDPERLRPIGRAVKRAARHLPWHPLCLPQAMAARAMLRRRHIASTLHLGVAVSPDDRAMSAHAWLTVGKIDVIGSPAQDDFTVLARFSR
jgi:hypothetical protein